MDFEKEFVELFKLTGEAHDAESIEARQAFAAALRLPLNREIERQNIARTIFMVDKLEPGAQAVYELDLPEIDAWVMPRIGHAPQNVVGVEELYVPTFEVTSSIEWKLQLAREGRINIVQRKTKALRNAIVKLENDLAFQMVRAALKPERTVTIDEDRLDKAALNAGFQLMEGKDGFRPDVVLMNARRAGDVREWGAVELDQVTMREVWRNAGLGNIWGADIIVWNELKDDEVWLIDTEEMGVMPIRQDFVTYDDPGAIARFRQRVLGYEEIGFAVTDADAIVKIELTGVGAAG